jgi:hypothetical protein
VPPSECRDQLQATRWDVARAFQLASVNSLPNTHAYTNTHAHTTSTPPPHVTYNAEFFPATIIKSVLSIQPTEISSGRAQLRNNGARTLVLLLVRERVSLVVLTQTAASCSVVHQTAPLSIQPTESEISSVLERKCTSLLAQAFGSF